MRFFSYYQVKPNGGVDVGGNRYAQRQGQRRRSKESRCFRLTSNNLLDAALFTYNTMANKDEFYISDNLAAIEKLSAILAPHGIQITNILNVDYAMTGRTGSVYQRYGVPLGVHPKLTIELFVPLETEEPTEKTQGS